MTRLPAVACCVPMALALVLVAGPARAHAQASGMQDLTIMLGDADQSWWPGSFARPGEPSQRLGWLQVPVAPAAVDTHSYDRPRLERMPTWQSFMNGRYGLGSWSGPYFGGPQASPFGDSLSLPSADPAPACRPPTVTLLRSNGERERVILLDCDGAVTADAVDRLSVMARPYTVERPELPLPPEPDPRATEQGEWVPGVKLVHPRLVWVLSRIGQVFPRSSVQIVSGYRYDKKPNQHTRGRALDLRVTGVSNEALHAFCRKLPDVGCGYYPNSSFVHVDVRPLDAGHVVWVDVSGPGQKSSYVQSWPGVL